MTWSCVCWHQESSSSVLVSGVQFQSGTPGSRELYFTYRSYVEQVTVKVAPGVPAQLKLVSEPEKVGQDLYWWAHLSPLFPYFLFSVSK